jgi:uncharacterized protein YjbI with pentapeptide repeats
MPEAVVAEQPETQVAEAEQRCPVQMYKGRRCGRPIYKAPPGSDEEPVCLMHSRDPQKSDSAFQNEFDAILKQAEEHNEVADFTRFIFPSAKYAHREFKTRCWFERAAFTQKADFSDATFTQSAVFAHATFTQNAIFDRATFTQIAYFYRVTFTQEADFCRATFMQNADFSHATFAQKACFLAAQFTQKGNFEKAVFAKEVLFARANFSASAAFREAIFRGDKKKLEARLEELRLELEPEADDTLPGPVFSLAQFEKPELVLFYKTYLGQALFHNCDASKLAFRQVEWRRRRNGKSMVFEEVADPNSQVMEALKPPENSLDKRNYRLIGELYHELKKNYDERRDYWTAGDFHYGEMEMKRLHSPRRSKALRWLHRNLGLVAWYKYASEYGESYGRPVLWLVGVLILFTLLFPIWGLRPSARSSAPEPTAPESRLAAKARTPELSYSNFVRHHSTEPGGPRITFWQLLRDSAMTTLGVAAFQRDLAYEPSYPWGRLLAILEILLTSTLLALFLLAVRRQFRR